jgi:hypothetical protein
MEKPDAVEAAPIVVRALKQLAGTISAKGREGSDARTAIGDAIAFAYPLLRDDQLGEPLKQCFELARLAGATLYEMEAIRRSVSRETPKTVGGFVTADVLMILCLAEESIIVANMVFASRQEVDYVKQNMVEPFAEAEEIAADTMDQAGYQILITLHASVTNHLVVTARPLPRLLNFQFFEPLPSLVIAYKLYDDASRADEVRAENRIVHPAFCPVQGQALSA